MFKLAPSTSSATQAVEHPYEEVEEVEEEEEESEEEEEEEVQQSISQQSTAAATADKKQQLESLPIWEDYMPDLSKEIKDLNRILAQAVESGSLNKKKIQKKKGQQQQQQQQ